MFVFSPFLPVALYQFGLCDSSPWSQMTNFRRGRGWRNYTTIWVDTQHVLVIQYTYPCQTQECTLVPRHVANTHSLCFCLSLLEHSQSHTHSKTYTAAVTKPRLTWPVGSDSPISRLPVPSLARSPLLYSPLLSFLSVSFTLPPHSHSLLLSSSTLLPRQQNLTMWERERESKCHLSHLIHNLWVCVCVCLCVCAWRWICWICLCTSLCICCVCVCGAWVSKWESCVELVHRFITKLRQCEGKHSTFVCLTAYSSAISVFSIWCSL